MFLAILLVCNNQGECVAVKAPKLVKTYDECVKQLALGSENMVQQRLTVADLVCIQFRSES